MFKFFMPFCGLIACFLLALDNPIVWMDYSLFSKFSFPCGFTLGEAAQGERLVCLIHLRVPKARATHN